MSDDDKDELDELDLSDVDAGDAGPPDQDEAPHVPAWHTPVFVMLVPGLLFAIVLAIFALLLR
jgi:hypothetical protein